MWTLNSSKQSVREKNLTIEFKILLVLTWQDNNNNYYFAKIYVFVLYIKFNAVQL